MPVWVWDSQAGPNPGSNTDLLGHSKHITVLLCSCVTYDLTDDMSPAPQTPGNTLDLGSVQRCGVSPEVRELGHLPPSPEALGRREGQGRALQSAPLQLPALPQGHQHWSLGPGLTSWPTDPGDSQGPGVRCSRASAPPPPASCLGHLGSSDPPPWPQHPGEPVAVQTSCWQQTAARTGPLSLAVMQAQAGGQDDAPPLSHPGGPQPRPTICL